MLSFRPPTGEEDLRVVAEALSALCVSSRGPLQCSARPPGRGRKGRKFHFGTCCLQHGFSINPHLIEDTASSLIQAMSGHAGCFQWPWRLRTDALWVPAIMISYRARQPGRHFWREARGTFLDGSDAMFLVAGGWVALRAINLAVKIDVKRSGGYALPAPARSLFRSTGV